MPASLGGANCASDQRGTKQVARQSMHSRRVSVISDANYTSSSERGVGLPPPFRCDARESPAVAPRAPVGRRQPISLSYQLAFDRLLSPEAAVRVGVPVDDGGAA